MPPEISALFDKPHLLFIVVLSGAIFGMAVEQAINKVRRNAWRKRGAGRWQGRPAPRGKGGLRLVPSAERQPDAADQLRIVMAADFAVQPLLNKGETRVYRELFRLVQERNPAWQVMAQVSLGEILTSKDSAAFGCINAKRVDLLLVDDNCTPCHVLEYQGSGHHQGSAAARDAIKKEALRRAGIAYHEVVAGHTTPSELRRLVEKIVPAAQGQN